jgi:hypothetical protein
MSSLSYKSGINLLSHKTRAMEYFIISKLLLTAVVTYIIDKEIDKI